MKRTIANKSLLIAGLLLGQTVTSTAGQLEQFVENQNVTVKALVLETFKSSIDMNSKLAQGLCDSTERATFEGDVARLYEFDKMSTDELARQFSGNDPVSTGASRIVQAVRRAWHGSVSIMELGAADVALRFHCLDVADRYYRDVVNFNSTEVYVRRALIGIEDVRDKRRAGN